MHLCCWLKAHTYKASTEFTGVHDRILPDGVPDLSDSVLVWRLILVQLVPEDLVIQYSLIHLHSQGLA